MVEVQSLRQRTFSADEVLRMVDLDLIHEDEPLELLEGELIVVVPQGPVPRTLAVELADRLRPVYAGVAHIQSHSPFLAADNSLPEPDVAVVRGSARDYLERYPTGKEILLAVEIVVTSHELDRAKTRIYATAGIPEYWFLDVAARCLRAHREPADDRTYRVVTLSNETESISPPGSSETWLVGELLP